MTQDNAWGRTTLADIQVDCTFPNGETCVLELQIEPDLIVMPSGSVRPGVAYNPEYYGLSQFHDLGENCPDIGEIVAYGINEGGATSDTIETDSGDIAWRVRDTAALKLHNVID